MKFINATSLHRKSGQMGHLAFVAGGGEQQVPPLRYPVFPVEVGGVGELHAAFLTESRKRGRW